MHLVGWFIASSWLFYVNRTEERQQEAYHRLFANDNCFKKYTELNSVKYDWTLLSCSVTLVLTWNVHFAVIIIRAYRHSQSLQTGHGMNTWL